MNKQSPLSPENSLDQQDIRLKAAGLTQTLDLHQAFANKLNFTPERSYQSLLFQFETLLSYGKITDPRVILQTVNLYLVSNQQEHGIALFDGILSNFKTRMSEESQAIYEASLGILRATYADKIPLHRRIAWVRDSVALIESALRRTGGEHPIPHWAAGMVYAQLPWFFFKAKQAMEHLTWLVDRPDTEPTFGFYREVYHQLAALYKRAGDKQNTDHWLHRSSYQDYQPNAMLMGWFTTGPDGTAMSPHPVLEEIRPNRIFALYGFGFSDIFFVLSDDGQELIAIDAGTQPHSLQAAHEFLLSKHPQLPQITTAFITHSHWDHIGGHGYLRAHNPNIRIFGRSNYGDVTERVLRHHSYDFFRSTQFDHDWIKSYAPTHPVFDRETQVVGGTEISLFPVTGGETEDAMLIHFPGLDTVFVGDVVMPWYGEPWVNEGFAGSATETMDQVLELGCQTILHGHHPLTLLFGDPKVLRAYRDMHDWLVHTTKTHIRNGFSAKDIARMTLIPPELVAHPDVTLAYAASRDNVIARIAQDMAGIWREDRSGQAPEGLDLITTVERANMLKHFGLSKSATLRGINRMIAAGENDLALQISVAAEQAFGRSPDLRKAKEQAADRLRSIAQFVDPFRFTAYSEMIERPHLPTGSAANKPQKG